MSYYNLLQYPCLYCLKRCPAYNNQTGLLWIKWRSRRQRRMFISTICQCFAKNVTLWTVWKLLLFWKKGVKESIKEKLNNIIGGNYLHELIQRNAMVCRNCYYRVISLNDFIEKCKHKSIQSFLNTSVCKRDAFSPLTRRSISYIQLSVLSVRKSRKILKLDSVDHVSAVDSSERVSPFIDYDYASKCDARLKRRMIQFFISSATFLRKRKKKVKRLLNLRSRCQSLTPRTAIF